MGYTERHCWKIKDGEFLFIPDLNYRCKLIYFYKTLLSYHNGRKVNTGNWRSNGTSLQIGSPFNISLDEIKYFISYCTKEYIHLKSQALHLRNGFICKKVQCSQRPADSALAQRLKILHACKQLRKEWREVWHAVKPWSIDPIFYVDVQEVDHVVILTVSLSVEIVLIEEHKNNFTLAAECTFNQQSIIHHFCGAAESPSAIKSICNFNFSLVRDTFVLGLLQTMSTFCCQFITSSISCHILTSQFTSEWRSYNEDTSSYIASLHFRIRKKMQWMDTFCQLILNWDLLHCLMVIPFLNGINDYQSWFPISLVAWWLINFELWLFKRRTSIFTFLSHYHGLGKGSSVAPSICVVCSSILLLFLSLNASDIMCVMEQTDVCKWSQLNIIHACNLPHHIILRQFFWKKMLILWFGSLGLGWI